jgi:hypothetical protein
MNVLMLLSLAPVQAKSVYKELYCEELNQMVILLFINKLKMVTLP